MSNKTINSAIKHPVFIKVLSSLITNRFYSEVNLQRNKEGIDEEEIEHAIWLATIIATSNNEDDKYISSVFGILLFLEYDDIDYNKVAFIILSRSGNLISSKFFTKLISFESAKDSNFLQFNERFGTTLDYEIGAKLSINEIDVVGGDSIIGSDYQKKLWDSLINTNENIAISAPTSAGKSFIIQNYILDTFTKVESFFAVYIVPTRALIAQVSQDFKNVLGDDVSINTAYIDNDDKEITQFRSKELYILTPERTLKLIQESYNNPINPDLIFIDEVQNIENEDSRGFLFEFLLNEIENLWPQSRKIIAGPFLDKPHILFKLIFSEESKNLQTIFSPVFQLKACLRPDEIKNKLIIVKLFFQGMLINELEIDVDFNFKKLISNKKKALVKIVMLFGRESKNIIYFPRPDWAEGFSIDLAAAISKQLNDDKIKNDEDINDLIDLIKEEVHPEYFLIDGLKTKTAFHHGKLPEIIRGELEHLFSSGKLDNIVCTSTLMEGINLPAEKVFIAHAKKDNIKLNPFELGNIVGRAGRIKDSLIGTVLCLENEEEKWAEEQFSNNPEMEIVPAINKLLNHPIDEIIEAIRQPLDDNVRNLDYATCFLKHKYLQGEEVLENYLKKKNLNEESIIAILDSLSTRLDKLKIPSELLRLNPSIDPELQNELYIKIKKKGVKKWVFHDNENFNRRWGKIERHKRSHSENNFFGQLENILFKLDEIFDFNAEAYFKHNISRTVPHMVYYAIQWLDNKSMKELINQEINFYANIRKLIDKNDRGDINKKINEVIKVYSSIISFVLVKYLKLLADILETFLDDEEKEKYKLSLSIPTMLELGTYNAVVLLLISKGLSRSVAIKIYPLIPEEEQEEPLEWLSKQKSINKLGKIYNKYLKRKGFLLQDDEL
ncbi:helicase-like protein [Winogradskyella eximia]|uniref:Helicase-like protein n=1 Tax=Winogradskyella eximia TaxID=262006 RepID=A0A3D9H705_9FLAO|nr:DEAD/DEAH box helicase [Winogradskyella eximia]RED45283.1 helicase-like protein [Winogradskyella eximia]